MATLGRYHVGPGCSDCGQCQMTARAHFARDRERGVSTVRLQPRSAREEELCELARVECPAQAIELDLQDPPTR